MEKLSVVLALNQSDNSKYCLQWAMDHFLDGKLHKVTLLTVVEPPVQAGYYYAASGAIYSAQFIDEAYAKATEEATKTVKHYYKVLHDKYGSDLAIDLIVGRGEVRDEIVDYVNNNAIGLLVIGSRSLGTLKR